MQVLSRAAKRSKKETDEQVRERFKYAYPEEELRKIPIAELRRRLREYRREDSRSKTRSLS
jgi:hypothetical protein